jgi:hypothetical protein
VLNDQDCDDTIASRSAGASEVCGDGVINDCTLTASEACGELSISSAPAGQLKLNWRSDCVVQRSEDGEEWADFEVAPTRADCEAELLFTPSSPNALFRLRLP